MILKQKFKTLRGAQKRCDFENAHSYEYAYSIRWFVDGIDITDKRASYVARHGAIKHWQLEKRPTLAYVGYRNR
jgi:hypothetical protein